MMRPEDFYSSDDMPSGRSQRTMWDAIQQQALLLRSDRWLIRDARSFLYGMAATIVLGLALVGAWTIARQSFENAQPQPLRLEQAYVSAIHEFERVMPSAIVSKSQLSQASGQLTQRKEQIKLVDAAIVDLRKQTNGMDLSPLKRERLRQLYSMKLQVLQQMIEEGEIEL